MTYEDLMKLIGDYGDNRVVDALSKTNMDRTETSKIFQQIDNLILKMCMQINDERGRNE